MRYEVNFTDNITGATSAIDIIEANEEYTSEQYIKDCAENADSNWNNMLKNGTISLIAIG